MEENGKEVIGLSALVVKGTIPHSPDDQMQNYRPFHSF